MIEDGPVRAGIHVRYRWGESEAEQTFYLCDGLPRIDACLFVDWHERHKMLKLAFPTALADAVATFAVPFGAVARPASGEEQPLQRWLDLSGTVDGKAAGLALCNDGKYGADVLGSEMRLSLLRSPIYAFHDPRKPDPGETYRYIDQGEHLIRYRLVPHAGSWQEAGVVREAQSLNVPVYFRYEMVQDGDITSVASAVTAELKKAEDGDDAIVRVYESAGQATEARVSLHFAETEWDGTLAPFEIKTLRFDLDARRVVEVDMLERRS